MLPGLRLHRNSSSSNQESASNGTKIRIRINQNGNFDILLTYFDHVEKSFKLKIPWHFLRSGTSCAHPYGLRFGRIIIGSWAVGIFYDVYRFAIFRNCWSAYSWWSNSVPNRGNPQSDQTSKILNIDNEYHQTTGGIWTFQKKTKVTMYPTIQNLMEISWNLSVNNHSVPRRIVTFGAQFVSVESWDHNMSPRRLKAIILTKLHHLVCRASKLMTNTMSW